MNGHGATAAGPLSMKSSMPSTKPRKTFSPNKASSRRLRYWLASIAAGGCPGPSESILPWSSRNGGYWSVINDT